MDKYKKYKEAFPNKTDAQCIESLCWEVSDKVETIHKLLLKTKKVYICYMSLDYEGVLDYSIKLFRNKQDAMDFGKSENTKYGCSESTYTIKLIEIN